MESDDELDPDFLDDLKFNELLGRFLDDAENLDELLDDEGRAYAQNLAENLADSVIPERNELEAAAAAQKTEKEILDSLGLEMGPQNERNVEASFKAHLRALQRRIAGQIGQDQKARAFMKLNEGKPPVILKLHQYAAGNEPNLASHPHDTGLSVPIPPGYEDVASRAASFLKMTRAEREAEMTKLRESFKKK